VLVELGLTAIVLGVTSALVQIPPPRTAEAAEVGPTNTTVTQTLNSTTTSLQVDLFPAAVGNNSIHLYAYTPDNKPQPVVEWTATAALPAKNIEPIEVPLLRITDFHAIGDIALPQAGEWTFRFTVRTSDIDRATFSMTATVK
jgi:copper transport protein